MATAPSPHWLTDPASKKGLLHDGLGSLVILAILGLGTVAQSPSVGSLDGAIYGVLLGVVIGGGAVYVETTPFAQRIAASLGDPWFYLAASALAVGISVVLFVGVFPLVLSTLGHLTLFVASFSATLALGRLALYLTARTR